MADYEPIKCKSCGAKIRFIQTGWKDQAKKEKKMCPVNEPAELRWVLVGGKHVLVHVWQSHFETCPNAQQHRQPRQQAPAPAAEPDEFDIAF